MTMLKNRCPRCTIGTLLGWLGMDGICYQTEAEALQATNTVQVVSQDTPEQTPPTEAPVKRKYTKNTERK